MSNQENPEEFYTRLKDELSNTSLWPALYLYKFIAPTTGNKVASIEKIFDDTGAVIETKQSSNGKYTSLSIRVTLKNPDAVIEKYKAVGALGGIISL